MTLASPELTVVQAARDAIDELAEMCARAYLVSMDEFYGRDRHKRPAAARALFCRVLRDHGWSYPEIGAELDRDHTTIMYLVTRADAAQVRAITEAWTGAPAPADIQHNPFLEAILASRY